MCDMCRDSGFCLCVGPSVGRFPHTWCVSCRFLKSLGVGRIPDSQLRAYLHLPVQYYRKCPQKRNSVRPRPVLRRWRGRFRQEIGSGEVLVVLEVGEIWVVDFLRFGGRDYPQRFRQAVEGILEVFRGGPHDEPLDVDFRGIRRSGGGRRRVPHVIFEDFIATVFPRLPFRLYFERLLAASNVTNLSMLVFLSEFFLAGLGKTASRGAAGRFGPGFAVRPLWQLREEAFHGPGAVFRGRDLGKICPWTL